MTVGLSAANFANTICSALSSGSATLIASHVQMHNDDPGSAGTANVATGVTGRQALTWGTPSGGSVSVSNTPISWSATGTDTVSYLSTWNASTSGTFRFSAQLTAPKAVSNGDTLNLTSLTFALTPIAA